MKLHTQPYLIYTNHAIQAHTFDIVIFSKVAKISQQCEAISPCEMDVNTESPENAPEQPHER